MSATKLSLLTRIHEFELECEYQPDTDEPYEAIAAAQQAAMELTKTACQFNLEE